MAMSAEKTAAATIDVRQQNEFKAPSASAPTLRGEALAEGSVSMSVETGRLFYSPEELKALTDLRDAGNLVYVVYSYATPIAWVDREGNKTLTELDHSAMTKRHKAIVRAAWNL